MKFTLVSPARRTIVALFAALVVAVGVYETRMLDSGYGAWLDMLGTEEGPPSPGAHLAFDATAYCKGQTTAAGVNVRRGIAAADPQLLPVGSVVTVATGDPEYNGVYTIMDTGPEVKGRELDLYIWSCHEALKFGRRRIEVTVLRLGWDPRASSPSLIDRLFRRREVARRAAASRDEKTEPAAPVPVPVENPHGGDGFGAEAMPIGTPEPMETVPADDTP
jgi:3D (Asp-Asp-Asp) domain-containing protein